MWRHPGRDLCALTALWFCSGSVDLRCAGGHPIRSRGAADLAVRIAKLTALIEVEERRTECRRAGKASTVGMTPVARRDVATPAVSSGVGW